MKFRDSKSALVSAYIEGRATADEIRQLEMILRAEPEFRRLFVEHLNVDVALADIASREEAPKEIQRAHRPGYLPARYGRWPAVAACAMAALAIAVWGLSQRTTPSSSLTTRIEVLDISQESEFSIGQIVADRRISIDRGSLSLRLDDGPTLELSAPADVEILDGLHVRVHSGGVTVDVGEDVDGFVLDTTAARFVDLGTRFAVSVDPSAGETDVIVLEGEIEVNEPAGASTASPYASLIAGDALTIAPNNAVRRLAAVSMTSRVTRLDQVEQAGIVTTITDNVADPEYRRFYGLVPGGMREDELAYTTIGRARWHSAEGEEFPAELLGADAIRTFHDDRRSWDLNISIDLAGPAAMYVMVDARNPTPDWLLEDFADTGLQLRTGPWREVGVVEDVTPGSDGGLYVSYRVWKREILAAGTVTLGPPRTRGQPGNRAMYGIAVRAM